MLCAQASALIAKQADPKAKNKVRQAVGARGGGRHGVGGLPGWMAKEGVWAKAAWWKVALAEGEGGWR